MSKIVSGVDAIQAFRASLNIKPERWPCGEPFARMDLRPRSIVMFMGPPGATKTTLGMQMMYGALTNNPSLRCLVSCVELDPDELFAKVLASLAGVSLNAIMDAEMTTQEQRRVEKSIDMHTQIWERITFMSEPYTIVALGDAMTQSQSQFAIIDYIQRFEFGRVGDAGDERTQIKNMVTQLRIMARKGAGFLVLSSVSRQKNQKGQSSYADLNLASGGGSSSLEFGANDVYVVTNDDAGIVTLKCEKKRFGDKQASSMALRFNGAYQTYSACDPVTDATLTGFGPAGGPAMTDRRPAPGTAWYRLCRNAIPYDWCDDGDMPEGFGRFATDREEQLITGRITEDEFLGTAQKPEQTPPVGREKNKEPRPKRERKQPAVVAKIAGLNRFLDALTTHDPRLHPLAVAIWCWLHRCEQRGIAVASTRTLANRLGVSKNSVTTQLKKLAELGYVELVHRGQTGASASHYRVRSTPLSHG